MVFCIENIPKNDGYAQISGLEIDKEVKSPTFFSKNDFFEYFLTFPELSWFLL